MVLSLGTTCGPVSILSQWVVLTPVSVGGLVLQSHGVVLSQWVVLSPVPVDGTVSVHTGKQFPGVTVNYCIQLHLS